MPCPAVPGSIPASRCTASTRTSISSRQSESAFRIAGAHARRRRARRHHVVEWRGLAGRRADVAKSVRYPPGGDAAVVPPHWPVAPDRCPGSAENRGQRLAEFPLGVRRWRRRDLPASHGVDRAWPQLDSTPWLIRQRIRRRRRRPTTCRSLSGLRTTYNARITPSSISNAAPRPPRLGCRQPRDRCATGPTTRSDGIRERSRGEIASATAPPGRR